MRYEKITVYFVFPLAFLLSFSFFLYYFIHHHTLAYYDAKAHLQIAKQVTNGLTPGFAQLGGVWLPLLHLLMLPTVWMDSFYYSGLAGSIISMIAYVLASVVLFKTCQFLFQDKKASFLATLVFMLNPNVLYFSSIPMMESLYLLTFLAALYFFIKFLATEKPQHLVLSAISTFFATLTRYEGWSLIPVIAVAILLVSWKRKWGYRKLEGMLLSYVTLAGFGVALWLLWNAVIFIVIYVLFVLGLCLYLVRHLRKGVVVEAHKDAHRGNDAHKGLDYAHKGLDYTAGAYLFLLPFFFHTLALSLGFIPMLIPGLSGVGVKEMFNGRLAVLMMPAVAFFVGYLVRGRRIAFWGVLTLVLFQFAFMFARGDIVTLKDGVNGWASGKPRKVEKWLDKNYDDGLILTDSYANTCRFVDMKIPMNRFIHQGTFKYWQESLENPTKHAQWIWMTQDDRVWKAIWKKDEFRKNFRQVFKDGRTLVYQRKE